MTSNDPVAGEAGTIPASLTGMVVGGNDAGWMADLDGRLWRVDTNGTVTNEGDIPNYNRGVATFFAGHVVFGGTRCDGEIQGESCNGDAVVELRLIDESDPASVEIVEISRGSGGDFRSVGIGLEGIVDGALWVHRDTGELVQVSAAGEVTTVDVAAGADAPQPCAVDGVLYGVHGSSAIATSDESAPSSPPPTTADPGAAVSQGEEAWTMSRLEGESWQPVGEGIYRRDGPEATVTCLGDGVVVHPYATLNEPLVSPYAVWTPDAGWRTPPAGLIVAGGSTVVAPGSSNLYVVASEGVSRLDLDAGAVPVPLDLASLSDDPIAIASLDDSGDLLIACSEVRADMAQCVVSPTT